MSVKKSFEEINEKIKKGTVVVVTAEEMIDIAKEKGIKDATRYVDVVTTATFGPMCSSGAFLNFGHADPPIRMTEVLLNNVTAYAGLAAVDVYIGATEPSKDKGIEYGGAHVICDLIEGKKVHLKATSPGTDCYPKKEIDTYITKDFINEAYLFNPRNCYQNYNAAVNTSDRTLYTYMGVLQPNMANINYSTSGELSPLLNDPYLRTIGIIALLIPGENKSVGVCTSSGKVGHSLSFGKADAVVVLSRDTLLADAAATAICNMVKGIDDIKQSIDFANPFQVLTGS